MFSFFSLFFYSEIIAGNARAGNTPGSVFRNYWQVLGITWNAEDTFLVRQVPYPLSYLSGPIFFFFKWRPHLWWYWS